MDSLLESLYTSTGEGEIAINAPAYGIILDVPSLDSLREMTAIDKPTKAEVLLNCSDSSRTCTFEELVAFMKGEGK